MSMSGRNVLKRIDWLTVLFLSAISGYWMGKYLLKYFHGKRSIHFSTLVNYTANNFFLLELA